MKIVSSKPVSLEEARKILEKRKEDGEFGYEQEQALDYVGRFAKEKEAEKIKELAKNKKIPLEVAVKIVDIAPKKPETLKAILLKDRIELSEDEIAGIIKTVS